MLTVWLELLLENPAVGGTKNQKQSARKFENKSAVAAYISGPASFVMS